MVIAIRLVLGLTSALCSVYLWATNGMPLVDLVVLGLFSVLLISGEAGEKAELPKEDEDIEVSIHTHGSSKNIAIN